MKLHISSDLRCIRKAEAKPDEQEAQIMQLRFFGQTYSIPHPQVKTLVLDRTGKFIGLTYSFRRSTPTYKSRFGLRKYRESVARAK